MSARDGRSGGTVDVDGALGGVGATEAVWRRLVVALGAGFTTAALPPMMPAPSLRDWTRSGGLRLPFSGSMRRIMARRCGRLVESQRRVDRLSTVSTLCAKESGRDEQQVDARDNADGSRAPFHASKVSTVPREDCGCPQVHLARTRCQQRNQRRGSVRVGHESSQKRVSPGKIAARLRVRVSMVGVARAQ